MRNGKHTVIFSARTSATLTKWWWRHVSPFLLVLAASVPLPAQEVTSPDAVKFQTLFSFNGNYESDNFTQFVQGTDGNLWGPTGFGGANGNGAIFKMTLAGTMTTVYSFCAKPNCADGWLPVPGAALALGVSGSFYGVTVAGGANCLSIGGCGTIFKITPSGTLTTIYNFCSQPNCVDGTSFGYAGVVRGADGNFYGVTVGGGLFSNPLCIGGYGGTGCGSVFRVTPDGAFTTLYSFCSQSNCTDGASPLTGLVSGTDGDLYGITSAGGANGIGTIFKITLGGELTTLHSFAGTEGNCFGPCEPMIQANNGKFYGAPNYGGANGAGTVFEITPAGVLKTLYNFCSQPNCADGWSPNGLVQGTDGNFYGPTEGGGQTTCSGGCGTIFKITKEGALTTLHNFDGADGYAGQSLAQATNGAFYGVTNLDGAYGQGTAFSLSVGLGPFVTTLPTSGKEGDRVIILGTDLTGATSVRFDAKQAQFEIVSPTEIVTTVPHNASTSFVTVTTPNGPLKSNVKFRVQDD